MSDRDGQFHIIQTSQPPPTPPPGPPPPHGRVLCTVLVTIPLAGPSSLIEFYSRDKYGIPINQ